MKGWIVAVIFGMLAGVSTAESMNKGDVVAITFTREGTANGTAKGAVLGASNAVINAVCPEAAFARPAGLVLSDTDGRPVDVRIESWVNQGATAVKGTVSRRIRPDQGKPFQSVFGLSMVTGSTYGGALNAHLMDRSLSLTFAGLVPGQKYELYMLTGRGNTSWSVPAADRPIVYSLSGVDELEAELLGASNKRTALNNQALESFERNTDSRFATGNGAWSLVKWHFKAGETGMLTLATDANGNINALALKAVSDDPSKVQMKLVVLGAAGGFCLLLMLALVLVARRRQRVAASRA